MTTIVITRHSQRFAIYTSRARKVLELAEEEARRLNFHYIGTEHLLLGLVREDEGIAARALQNMNIRLDKVRSAVEFLIGRGKAAPPAEALGLTPLAVIALDLGVDEARRLNHHYIGTEHLLLGLIRGGQGYAVGILESLGVNILKLREETLEVVKEFARQDEEAATPSTEASAESSSAADAAQPSSKVQKPTRSSKGSTKRRTVSEEAPGI